MKKYNKIKNRLMGLSDTPEWIVPQQIKGIFIYPKKNFLKGAV